MNTLLQMPFYPQWKNPAEDSLCYLLSGFSFIGNI